nr:uncharacterized protein LOC100207574 isoform X2 [Hydra vulgaris]
MSKQHVKTMQLKEVYFVVWILLTFAFLAYVTSLTTAHWRVTDSYFEGLFERCEYGEDGCRFLYFFDHHSAKEFDVARILLLGACAFLIISTFLSYGSLCFFKNVYLAIILLNVLAFILSLIGLSLYTHHHSNSSFKWSFGLSWAGCLSIGVVILLMCLGDFCYENNKSDPE